MSERKGLTYKDAGVDIAAGNALVERIKPLVARTARPEMLTGLGGFGGLMGIPEGYLRPVLVSGTDGVGTKLKLAQMMNRHDTIGIDLVAMCVNDVIVQGAEPLFFLDYFATGKLDTEVAGDVIAGIAAGCQESGCALIGGETAEMPDMYAPGEYDLAGFNVGVAEYDRLVTGEAIRAGDHIVGVDSSGIHSNGYSLVRRILETTGDSLSAPFGDSTLGETLLSPTRIYVRLVLAALEALSIHGMAHITGGGLKENVIRVVPEDCGIEIDTRTWARPPVFDWLAEGGQVAALEMLTTFNCGIGYTFIVPPSEVDGLVSLAGDYGFGARRIGRVVPAVDHRVAFVGLD